MITRIELTRYRCFEKLDMEPTAYCVIVGANGTGKTTLLDLPPLLADLLQARNIAEAFTSNRRGGPPRARTLQELIFQQRGDFFSIAIEVRLPTHIIKDLLAGATTAIQREPTRHLTHLRYELRFQVFNKIALQVRNEYLFAFPEAHPPDRDGARLYGEHGLGKYHRAIISREYGGEAGFRIETKTRVRARETAVAADLLALPRVLFENGEDYPAARWLLQTLTDGALYYAPDARILCQASPPGQPTSLTADGVNLPWLAKELFDREEADRKQAEAQGPDTIYDLPFSDWVDHLRMILPELEDVTVAVREEDFHAYFELHHKGGFKVTSSGLSGGTLHILALTLPAYLEKQAALMIIEEPENGVHPRAVEGLLQSLSSFYDSQVWVSSHSPVVLARTELDQVWCARREAGGGVALVPGRGHPNLVDWHGGIDLGSLFAAGVLG